MNRLSNPLISALEFFARLFGSVILAILFGVLGTLIHQYLGITLFLVTFILGVAGSIKLLLVPSATA